MNIFKNILQKFESITNKYFLSAESYAKKIGVNVGKGCNISTKNFSSEPWLITIGDNVRIARNVHILTHGGLWSIRKLDKKYKKLEYFGKVTIKDNVYIGQGTIIMPGVTIERNCIIGASSVVTKSIPEGSIVAGNPVKYISKVDEFIDKILKYDNSLHGSSLKEKKEKTLIMKDDEFVTKPYLKIKN